MRVALLPDYAAGPGADAALAGGVEVRVYAGSGPGGTGVDDVGFYVPPYMGGPEGLSVMSVMPALRVCQTLTAGVDGVAAHLPPGVLLCNDGGVHDASTAELAVGLVLARLRRLDDFARAQGAGEWRHGRYDALADRTVLIVGFGGVGRAVAARLAPFEATVVPVATRARTEPGGTPVRGVDELPGLLPDADVVVLACPLTERTRGMVDGSFLARMRDGALLVNVARGPVVVTDALLAELTAGRLRAALDVTDPEPLPAGHPLWRAPGVLISPHVGGNTTAFLPRARRLVTEQLTRWARDEPLLHVVAGGTTGPNRASGGRRGSRHL